jgi:hypothetical protein
MDEKELNQLCEEICNQIGGGEDSIGHSEKLKINGVLYTYEEVEELETVDEGKYQNGGSVYAIGISDKEKSWKIQGTPLFFIEQDFTRSGSYYSDYYYDYEKPYRVKKITETITIEKWVCD